MELRREGWLLREAVDTDIDTLMTWFTGPADVDTWGGPDFRYPYTRDSFLADIHWHEMASFGLADPDACLVAFGQIYERRQRIHLARLVVAPAHRGRGIGTRLGRLLMEAGKHLFPHDEYSLFVYRHNVPAYACYRALGFSVSEYPRDMPYADVCDFLTRRAQPEEN